MSQDRQVATDDVVPLYPHAAREPVAHGNYITLGSVTGSISSLEENEIWPPIMSGSDKNYPMHLLDASYFASSPCGPLPTLSTFPGGYAETGTYMAVPGSSMHSGVQWATSIQSTFDIDPFHSSELTLFPYGAAFAEGMSSTAWASNIPIETLSQASMNQSPFPMSSAPGQVGLPATANRTASMEEPSLDKDKKRGRPRLRREDGAEKPKRKSARPLNHNTGPDTTEYMLPSSRSAHSVSQA